MSIPSPPRYDGHGLVNLMAEVEYRLGGTPPLPRLEPGLAAAIPEVSSIVLAVFDGLGTAQLDHPRASHLAASLVGSIDAPFPTTTTVSLATIATGLPPVTHGLIAYQMWMDEHDAVVNTIHMSTLFGDKLEQDHASFLPSPNLWERLADVGVECVAVQPAHFERSPLSLALYRGATFAGYGTLDEAIDIAASSAETPHRLVLVYVPHVDFAAHLSGQDSEAYEVAMTVADTMWSGLVERVPASAAVIGTADHGHIDIEEVGKVRLTKQQHEDVIYYGDARALFVKGDAGAVAANLPGTLAEASDLTGYWGPGPEHREFAARRPDAVVFANDGRAIFRRNTNDRMIGHHGSLTPAEREIPLLVR